MRGQERDGVTRRQALQLGAAAAGLLTLEVDQVAAADPAVGSARERSFDEGWRFFRGDASGAEAPAFDDGSWRVLDLPHDWSIEDLPYAPPPDGGATSDPSLLVTQVPPTEPVPPPVIGPFDPQQGRVVPDAALQVTFEIRGAGQLAAVGNGNPHNVDSFTQPRRYTWHGKALAILRPARKPGNVTLTATAHGLRPALLTLQVNRSTHG